MEQDIQEILLTEQQIKTRIRELGEILTAEYEGKDPRHCGRSEGRRGVLCGYDPGN